MWEGPGGSRRVQEVPEGSRKNSECLIKCFMPEESKGPMLVGMGLLGSGRVKKGLEGSWRVLWGLIGSFSIQAGKIRSKSFRVDLEVSRRVWKCKGGAKRVCGGQGGFGRVQHGKEELGGSRRVWEGSAWL